MLEVDDSIREAIERMSVKAIVVSALAVLNLAELSEDDCRFMIDRLGETNRSNMLRSAQKAYKELFHKEPSTA